VRVARSRELVARGRPAAVVARVAAISRQAIYRRPRRPPRGHRRPLDEVDRVVLEVAREDEHATDKTRMIAAIASPRAWAGDHSQALTAADARARAATTDPQ
jgi:hypothetical protein